MFGRSNEKEKGMEKLNTVRSVFSGLMTKVKEATSHLVTQKGDNIGLIVALENENLELDDALEDAAAIHEGLKKLVK